MSHGCKLGDIVNVCDAAGDIGRGMLANHADTDENGAYVVNDRFDVNFLVKRGSEWVADHGVSDCDYATSNDDKKRPLHWWP